MSAKKPIERYKMPQAELYVACRIGWESYNENLSAFTGFSNFYNASNYTDAIVAIDAAEAIGDLQARTSKSELTRISLVNNAKVAINNFNYLRSHIEKAFVGEDVEVRLDEAGYKNYEKAANYNWEYLLLMLKSCKTFIADNNAALVAGGMPVVFATNFIANADLVALKYKDFKDFQQDAREGTSNLINANNAIYDSLIKMFLDGQKIFSENAALRDRFVLERVKELITPNSGGKVLASYEDILAASAKINLGLLPTGSKKLRVRVIAGGPLEFGLSVDGLVFNGNTVTISGEGSETILIVDLVSSGNQILVVNQNASVQGQYKVEVLG